MARPLEIILSSAKWVTKKIKQPSSTASLVAVLAFLGVSEPDILANGITQTIAGVLAIYSVLKDDKSE